MSETPGCRTCFHCALPVPPGSHWTFTVDGAEQAFCCPACRAVATSIIDSGLGDYYRLRDEPGNRPDTNDPYTQHPLDNPSFQQELVTREDNGECSARFALGGLHCAACVWLIESRLQKLPGVTEARVHLGEQRLSLRWRPEQQSPGKLAHAVESLGYHLTPWHPERLLELQRQESRQSLQRLGIAGLAMMQTGMLAMAFYVGDFRDMEPQWRDLLRWVSFLFTAPVATWASWPFYRAAWNGIRHRTATMDLPVALAIASAFIASVVNTLIHGQHVYFDSVGMFAFFLLAGRHVEMSLRHRNRQDSLVSGHTLPWKAHRLERPDMGSPMQTVPALSIRPDDWLLVRPGEAVPVDGVIVAGQSSLSEAVLTGESLPVTRGPGDTITAGTLNHEQALVIRASSAQQGSRIAQMQAQLEQALSSKPPMAQLADRLASLFVIGILLAAAITAVAWWPVSPSQAFENTLAVLVASCPCALSLATPTALTAATYALAKQGFLITRPHVLETLPRITLAIFDKTGTLTRGELVVRETRATPPHTAGDCLAIAAALECASDHPVARAFLPWAGPCKASDIHYHTGAGASGTVDGTRYRIGQAGFLGFMAPDTDGHWIGLADGQQVLAWFALEDALREDAPPLLQSLQATRLRTTLLTGDRSAQGERLGRALQFDEVQTGASPEGKQTYIRARQAAGEIVMMVGDGVNDAAVLGSANVSVAMAGAAPLARLQADCLLTRPSLSLIATARSKALQTRRIIRENLCWAAGYNALAVPLAAMGWVPPWIAAIGMSASSLLVVANAARLARQA